MFRTRKKFREKVMTKVVESEGKWYCLFTDGIRQGDTREQAIENAYRLWSGKEKTK